MSINDNKIFFILLSILPLSIVAGPSVSLINISFITILYFFIFIKRRHYEFLYKDKTVRLLLLIYIYLILNSFVSIDYEIGLNRNLGFIRLILFFIALNYFFFVFQKISEYLIFGQFFLLFLLWMFILKDFRGLIFLVGEN